MIHPDTQIRDTGTERGLAVYATAAIPRGTITHVVDSLDVVLTRAQYEALPVTLRERAVHFGYMLPDQRLLVPWDRAKYTNHSACCNTLPTAYGLDVAICDIDPGTEITVDYSLLPAVEAVDPEALLDGELPHRPGEPLANALVHLCERRDRQIRAALAVVDHVAQPLLELVSPEDRAGLARCRQDEAAYRSVRSLLG